MKIAIAHLRWLRANGYRFEAHELWVELSRVDPDFDR